MKKNKKELDVYVVTDSHSFQRYGIRFFKPNAYLTIDEQLYPTKVRCRFMPNKPDKFGIKFWLLVDCTSKYVIDGFPYLGKDEERPKTESLPENIVKQLMRDHLGLGYNVTMDNFLHQRNLQII